MVDGRGKDSGYRDGEAGSHRLADHFDTSARPVVRVDVAKYQSYLDDPGLSDAEKEQFLNALWSIIVGFVDLGFGVHPLQDVCEQNDEIGIQGPMDAFNSLSLNNDGRYETTRDAGATEALEVE